METGEFSFIPSIWQFRECRLALKSFLPLLNTSSKKLDMKIVAYCRVNRENSYLERNRGIARITYIPLKKAQTNKLLHAAQF